VSHDESTDADATDATDDGRDDAVGDHPGDGLVARLLGRDSDGDGEAGRAAGRTDAEAAIEAGAAGVASTVRETVSRRRALQALGVAGIGAATAGALRVGDYRPYDPALPGRGDAEPRERVADAGRALHAVDHRAVTQVTVTGDGTDAPPYRSARYRVVRDHSRRRHLIVVSTVQLPPTGRAPALPGLFYGLHRDRAIRRARAARAGELDVAAGEVYPFTSVAFATDGATAFAHGSPTPTSAESPVSVTDATHTPRSSTGGYLSSEYVLPHRASWATATETDATTTYRIDTPDAYAQVPPFSAFAGIERLHEGCRIEATLDRETGLLRRLVDRRDVTRRPTLVDADERAEPAPPRRLQLEIDTRFDRYGTATVDRPDGLERLDLGARLEALVADLVTY
jgi:hypothetical protein